LTTLMACPMIVDLKNFFCPEEMKKPGFAYASIGRAPTFQLANLSIPGLSRSSSRTSADASRDKAMHASIAGIREARPSDARHFGDRGQKGGAREAYVWMP